MKLCEQNNYATMAPPMLSKYGIHCLECKTSNFPNVIQDLYCMPLHCSEGSVLLSFLFSFCLFVFISFIFTPFYTIPPLSLFLFDDMNAAIFARTGIRASATAGASPLRSGAYHFSNTNGKVISSPRPYISRHSRDHLFFSF